MARWMSQKPRTHIATLVRPSPGWWRWQCSCGRVSQQRWASAEPAEAAGQDHARRFNAENAAAVERGRQQGWREAIAALGDDERVNAWFRDRVHVAVAPPWPPNQYPPRREYADYLTSVAPTEGTQTSAD